MCELTNHLAACAVLDQQCVFAAYLRASGHISDFYQ